MNITTIIELENYEVEQRAGAKLVFAQEHIDNNIIETCVDYLESDGSTEKITAEEAMKKVFHQLKQEGVVPEKVEDFSYEMPACGQLKRKSNLHEVPQKVIISYIC